MKMLDDDATQQTLLKQAKVIYFHASNYKEQEHHFTFTSLSSLAHAD
jgi:hypothetical protein